MFANFQAQLSYAGTFCPPLTQVVLYSMVQHLLKVFSCTHGYTALDTHKEGFYKCPTGKIDIAMSLSEQVSLDRSAYWLVDVELTH
jgi:hypothetical protein